MNILLRFMIGGVFIWACHDKIIDPSKFAREISNYHVIPFGLENTIAIILPWLELFIGVGLIAGFYINATRSPWDQNYKMFDYVTEELPKLMTQVLGCDSKRLGITGHSMGGHGALISALKRPDVFRSCSAFAPISNPINCPWGQKAFTGYLGPDQALWQEWDACELATSSKFSGPILVDQGEADNFLEEQLKPDALATAFNKAGLSLIVRKQPNYDHSYYFISSFIGEHVAHHARELR